MSETICMFSASGVSGSVAEEFSRSHVSKEYEWVNIGQFEIPWYIPVDRPELVVDTLVIAEDTSIDWDYGYQWASSDGTQCDVYIAKIGQYVLYEIGIAD